MTRLNHEIFINVPPEKVWKTLANLEAVAKYNPGVAHAKYITAQKEGVGATRQCELKNKSVLKERVIGWNPIQSMTMELSESDWPVQDMQWTTDLTSKNGGTFITQKLQYRPKGVMGTILNFLIMKRMMNKSLNEIFESMKKYIEAGQSMNC
ncbi:MAG: SRPBCC family protein [Nitrospirae bacterium]|nr:SRPBCC family protein [Nitrospirota bacterium]